MADEILRELWAVKDRLAEECGHDMRRLFEHLKDVEERSSRPVADRTSLRKPPASPDR